MARYEINCDNNDSGWIDTTKPCGADGGMREAEDGQEEFFACAEDHEVMEYMASLEAALAERNAEVGRAEKRFYWLFQHCKHWQIGATHNTYTGFFISRIRSTGWCGGEERWEDERIAWAPPDESFASAIDRAISGEDPNAEILADIRRRKEARAALTPEEKNDG